MRWLWVGCAGQGLRPVKVFEQPAPRCRKPQCIRQPPRGVEPPPVPRPIARMPGSRTARLVRSPAITCRRPAQSPSILCGGRSPDGKIAESANHRSREGLVQVQGNCRVSHWAVAEGHLSPPIFGECHYARPDPVFLTPYSLTRRADCTPPSAPPEQGEAAPVSRATKGWIAWERTWAKPQICASTFARHDWTRWGTEGFLGLPVQPGAGTAHRAGLDPDG